jgi:hypothetical protein
MKEVIRLLSGLRDISNTNIINRLINCFLCRSAPQLPNPGTEILKAICGYECLCMGDPVIIGDCRQTYINRYHSGIIVRVGCNMMFQIPFTSIVEGPGETPLQRAMTSSNPQADATETALDNHSMGSTIEAIIIRGTFL